MVVHSTRRPGFALATALVAIVLVGLLIAGSFFGSTQEFRAGRNALHQERAMTAAEFGHTQVLNDFDVDAARAMARGEVATQTFTVQGGTTASVAVTKLNLLTFLIASEGVTASGTAMTARRRTGLLIRLDVPELPIYGAVTTSGSTRVAGNQTTSGADMNPSGWDCDESGPSRAGYVNDNAADVTPAGTCTGGVCISGEPKIAVDPLAGDPETYDEFGGIDYDSLTALADVVVPASSTPSVDGIAPVVVAGACDRTNTKNWGDPARNAVTPGACEPYFPIIHIKGSGTVTLKNGIAQGLLLVDGNLTINGNFEFYGPIIVKGNVTTAGMGNKVVGGIMAANEGCTTTPCNKLEGTSHLQFSRCTIMSTLITRAEPVLATRSWADLF